MSQQLQPRHARDHRDRTLGNALGLRELTPLGKAVVPIDVAAEHQAALVGLADIEQLRPEGNHVIHERLDGLGHEGLQQMALDRQPQARHGGDLG